MYNQNQTEEIIKRRHQIVLAYCKKKGWDMEDLEMEQIMEIRKTDDWKNVPKQVQQQY